MKLEFVEDSVELKEFEKTLKWEAQDNIDGDLDDYHTLMRYIIKNHLVNIIA